MFIFVQLVLVIFKHLLAAVYCSVVHDNS